MAGRVIPAFWQFMDDSGDPLAYGWLRFLESGSNNTDKNTFNDEDLDIVNTNPVRLDGTGRCPSVFGEGRYRVVSYFNDPNDESVPGAMIQSFDPVTVPGEGSTSGGGGTFDAWASDVTYTVGDIVTQSLKYYRSITTFNVNKSPSIEDGYWEEIQFMPVWNANISYDEGEYVTDGEFFYFSTIVLNTGNIPSTHPVEWRRTDKVYLTTEPFIGNYSVDVNDIDKLLTLSSAAPGDSVFTLPTMVEDNDGFVYAFFNASSHNLSLSPTVPSTMWLENPLVMGPQSFLQVGYNFSEDSWYPIGNNGPALGGQNLGTLTHPLGSVFLGTAHFVSNFDIELATVPLWRFHTNGSFYPLAGNAGPDVGLVSNQVRTIWQSGVHYFNNVGNAIAGDASSLSFVGNTILNLGITSDPSKTFSFTATALSIVNAVNLTGLLTITGNIVPGADNTHYLGGGTGSEFNRAYIGTGGIYLANATARIYHSGSHLVISNSTGNTYFDNPTSGDWYFRESESNRFILADTGQLSIVGNGSTTVFNLTLGASGQGKIYQAASYLALYTTQSLYMYSNSSLRWKIDTSGHLVPNGANSYNIGDTSNEVKNIYVYDRVYFGPNTNAEIYNSGSSLFGIVLKAQGLTWIDSNTSYQIGITDVTLGGSNGRVSFALRDGNGYTYTFSNWTLAP